MIAGVSLRQFLHQVAHLKASIWPANQESPTHQARSSTRHKTSTKTETQLAGLSDFFQRKVDITRKEAYMCVAQRSRVAASHSRMAPPFFVCQLL